MGSNVDAQRFTGVYGGILREQKLLGNKKNKYVESKIQDFEE